MTALSLISQCQTEVNSSDEAIFRTVLPMTLDSIIDTHVKERNKIIVNELDDDIGISFIEYYQQESDTLQYQLIENVIQNFNQRPEIEFKQIRHDNFELKKSGYSGRDLFGVMTLSRIALDDKQENGCFYIDYQCGKKCGSGYLVFITRNSHDWKINSIEKVWE